MDPSRFQRTFSIQMAGVRAARSLRPARQIESVVDHHNIDRGGMTAAIGAQSTIPIHEDEDEALARAISLSMVENGIHRDDLPPDLDCRDEDLAMAVELSLLSQNKAGSSKDQGLRNGRATHYITGASGAGPRGRVPQVQSSQRTVGEASTRTSAGLASAARGIGTDRNTSRPISGARGRPQPTLSAFSVVTSESARETVSDIAEALELSRLQAMDAGSWAGRPRLKTCKHCGKEYGSRSIDAHETQCRSRQAVQSTNIGDAKHDSSRTGGSSNPRHQFSSLQQRAAGSKATAGSHARQDSLVATAAPSRANALPLPRAPRQQQIPQPAPPHNVMRARGTPRTFHDTRASADENPALRTDEAVEAALHASRREAQAAADGELQRALRAAAEASRHESQLASDRRHREDVQAAVERSRREAQDALERQHREALRAAMEASGREAQAARDRAGREAMAAALEESRAEAERAAQRRLEEETRRTVEESRREFEAQARAAREAAMARSRAEAEAERQLRAAQQVNRWGERGDMWG